MQALLNNLDQIILYITILTALGILAWNNRGERQQTENLVSTLARRLDDPARKLVITELPNVTESIKDYALKTTNPYDDIPAEVLDNLADRVVERMISRERHAGDNDAT